MKARVTKSFPGCRDGELHVQTLGVGDVVEGNLAAVAVANGWAEADDPKKAPVKGKGKIIKFGGK